MSVDVRSLSIGSMVRARGREWVVLPSDDPEILRLRPLGGLAHGNPGQLCCASGASKR